LLSINKSFNTEESVQFLIDKSVVLKVKKLCVVVNQMDVFCEIDDFNFVVQDLNESAFMGWLWMESRFDISIPQRTKLAGN